VLIYRTITTAGGNREKIIYLAQPQMPGYSYMVNQYFKLYVHIDFA